jgi:hypothetical protein
MINTQNKEITPCLVRRENAGQGSGGGLVRLFCYPAARRRTGAFAGIIFRNLVEFSCLPPCPVRIFYLLGGNVMVATETDLMIGKPGNSVGEIVEHFVTPDIRDQFNDLHSGLSEFLSKWQISLDQNLFFSRTQ